MTLRKSLAVGTVVLALIAGAIIVGWFSPRDTGPLEFNGEQAFKHVEAQMAFGPRPPGSEANRKTGDYILSELKRLGWQAESQEFMYRDTVVRNIIGQAAIGQEPVIIVGAHYDTRWYADQDKVAPLAPVPGANDGASGAAVLLELARVLDVRNSKHEIWLAFFDAEDNGGINGWDWIVGSTYMANNLTVTPKVMILADMVGDADQQFYFDFNSDPTLSAELFQIAAGLGYGAQFIPAPKYAMHDDHIPFAKRGVAAVDLIDFDYPYWHTSADTIDKISSASLERVGRTIEVYVEQNR